MTSRTNPVQWWITLVVVGWGVVWVNADPPAAPPLTQRQKILRQLITTIDQRIEAEWTKHGITPAELTSDAEFIRRVSLDLTGRIPTTMAVREFLRDPDPQKRDKLIARLIGSAGFARHQATVWRETILPEIQSNPLLAGQGVQFESWLQQRFREQAGFDQIARDLLTRGGFLPLPNQPNLDQRLLAFYLVNENKAENLAAAVTRVFLGVRLECAQCHDHPFAPYTREQFWAMAAFFANFSGNQFRPAMPKQPTKREIAIPGTDKVVRAKFLTGQEPVWGDAPVDPRVVLTDWLVHPDNPYFARNAVNRVWAQMFGVGLIDPVDDPGEANPPSHPELLDELAKAFVEQGYDLSLIVQAIASSRTYQLSSRLPAGAKDDPRRFGRAQVRRLSAEQLFDSLVIATGYAESGQPNFNPGFVGPGSARGEFLSRFASQERPAEAQTSILQALTLMNGRFIADQTSVSTSRNLLAVLELPTLDSTAKQIETLYLMALSRPPRSEELARLVRYVDGGGATGDRRRAMADVFWVILNSAEFMHNH